MPIHESGRIYAEPAKRTLENPLRYIKSKGYVGIAAFRYALTTALEQGDIDQVTHDFNAQTIQNVQELTESIMIQGAFVLKNQNVFRIGLDLPLPEELGMRVLSEGLISTMWGHLRREHDMQNVVEYLNLQQIHDSHGVVLVTPRFIEMLYAMETARGGVVIRKQEEDGNFEEITSLEAVVKEYFKRDIEQRISGISSDSVVRSLVKPLDLFEQTTIDMIPVERKLDVESW